VIVAQQILTICDVCADDGGRQVDGATGFDLTGFGHAVTIDLCDLHEQQTRVIFDRLADLGRPTDGSKRPRKTRATRVGPSRDSNAHGEFKCPACDHVAVTAQSLGRHTREVHGKRVAALRMERGLPRGSGPHVCPDCGRQFARAASLGAHRFRAHDVRGASRNAADSVAAEADLDDGREGE